MTSMNTGLESKGLPKELIDHMKLARHSKESLIVCPYCSENKFTMANIASHYEVCVQDKTKAKIKKISMNRKKRIREKARGMYCHECDKAFKNANVLALHMTQVHEEQKDQDEISEIDLDDNGL